MTRQDEPNLTPDTYPPDRSLSRHIANIRFLGDWAEIKINSFGGYMLHRYGVPPSGLSKEEAERLIKQDSF